MYISLLLPPGVKSTSQLTATSPQGAHSRSDTDLVKLCVSESIPEERMQEACQPPTRPSVLPVHAASNPQLKAETTTARRLCGRSVMVEGQLEICQARNMHKVHYRAHRFPLSASSLL